MNVTKVTRRIHRYNEDGLFIKKNLFVVMDGASSLYPFNGVSSDAAIWVKYIKEELTKYQNEDLLLFLKQISQNFYHKYYADKKIEASKMPSCGMAICHIVGNQLMIYNIGDVEVCVKTKDNQFMIRQPELEKLDAIAIDLMKEISKMKNISILEARKEVNDVLIQNRKLMNKDNGYAVFAPGENMEFKFSKQEFNKNDVLGLFMATDGYAAGYRVFNLSSNYKDFYDLDKDVKLISKQIVEISKTDPLCNKYPRFKKLDDMTVIKIDYR